MSFFGFDTALPKGERLSGDDAFREGPSLGPYEYEDELGFGGEDEEVQDFLETEQEADAANADTFGETTLADTSGGRDDWSRKPEAAPKVGKDFDFVAANETFDRKVQRETPVPAAAGPGAFSGRTSVSPLPRENTIKALWDDNRGRDTSQYAARGPEPRMQSGPSFHGVSQAPRMLSAAEVEAQLLARPPMPQGVAMRPPVMPAGFYPTLGPPPGMGLGPTGPMPGGPMGPVMSLEQIEAAMRQQQVQRQIEAARLAQVDQDLANRARAAQQEAEYAKEMMQRSLADMTLRQQEQARLELAANARPAPSEARPGMAQAGRPAAPSMGEMRPMMRPGEVQIMPRPPQKMSFGFGGGGGGPRQGFDNRPDRFLQPMSGMRPMPPYGQRDHRNDLGPRAPDRPEHFASEEERRDWERRRRDERYRYIMSTHDRELIARIQLSQLYTPDPMNTDFYCQIYNLVKKQEATDVVEKENSNEQGLTWQQEMLMGSGKRGVPFKVTESMQRRVLEWIKEREERQAKPKTATAPLEHALGRVSLSSSKTPRQLLQVTSMLPTREGATSPSSDRPVGTRTFVGPLSSRGVLRRVENVYADVLDLEQRRRLGPGEGESEVSFRERNDEIRQRLWDELEVTADVGTEEPHPLVQFLSVGKGKKVFPRVMRQLSSERALAVLTILLSRMGELDAVKDPSKHPEADMFMECCVPPLVAVVREVPLRIISALLRVYLERNTLLSIAKTRVGLAVLTMLLARGAALMKSQPASGESEHGSAANADQQTWTELYDYVFSSLGGHLATLFATSGGRAAEAKAGDDAAVWQFLAAMAMGASTVEHQRGLVLDVREKVLEAARSGSDRDLELVNLFLHPLGLDSTMLTG
ncbi:topoisomerase II-associated protein PAT1 [Hyaloraphidium curvatum]|nr:topoisomerase II-associated protein PAT1 [Hyaloraphidium curvatum]